MKRRTTLKRLGAMVSTISATGCLGMNSFSGGSNETNTTTRSSTETMTKHTTASSSLFEGQPCPSFDTSSERTVCYHTVDTETAPVYLVPNPEHLTVGTDETVIKTVEFTLYNRSQQSFVIEPPRWKICRNEKECWSLTASGTGETDVLIVPPGEQHRWLLSLKPHPTPRTENTTAITVGLKEGKYAFRVSGHFADETHSRIECIALFAIERTTDSEK